MTPLEFWLIFALVVTIRAYKRLMVERNHAIDERDVAWAAIEELERLAFPELDR